MLSKDEIEKLEQQTKENPGGRSAQKALAYEATKLVHGADRTDSVRRVTSVLFGNADFTTLTGKDIDELAREIPVSSIGKSLIESLIETNIATSNGDARRLISSGAVSVNGEKVNQDMDVKSTSLIKKGKNSFILVR